MHRRIWSGKMAVALITAVSLMAGPVLIQPVAVAASEEEAENREQLSENAGAEEMAENENIDTGETLENDSADIAETPESESTGAGETRVYENAGLRLLVPEEYAEELLLIDVPDPAEDGTLFSVSEKASVEAAKAMGESETYGAGWLFAIGRISEEQLHDMICQDMSGMDVIAKDDGNNHYVFYHPTDVRLVRENYDDIDGDLAQWSVLNQWASDVRGSFAAENGLAEERFGNSNPEIHLYETLYGEDVTYTISTTQFGPLAPDGVDPAPFVERLTEGAVYDYVDGGEAPDGEYVVLSFPEENVRYDFFGMPGKENYIREVYDDIDYEQLYRVTFEDDSKKAGSIMQEWYDELALQNGLLTPPEAEEPAQEPEPEPGKEQGPGLNPGQEPRPEQEPGPEPEPKPEKKQTSGMTLRECREARVFQGTLDSVYTLSTWEFEEQKDVPYVSLKEYISLLFVENYNPALHFAWEGDVLLVSRNNVSVRVDTVNQTVSCDNWRAFLGPNAADGIPDGVVDKDEFIAMRPSVKNESTQTPVQGYGVDLKEYDVEMICLDGEVLMPFAIAQAVFAAPAAEGFLAYNGDDYFDIVDSVDSIYGTSKAAPNPYADMWYSGSFAGREELSEAYAKYNYAAMCLLLDLTYGHKEEKNIRNFDSYLEENGMKEFLLSTDPKDDVEPLKKLFSVLFDSGHDAEILSPSIIDSEGAIDKAQLLHYLLGLIGYDTVAELMDDLDPILYELMKVLPADLDLTGNKAGEEEPKMGPNVEKLIADMMRLNLLKPYGYGSSRVDIQGDTCIIYFDGFRENVTRPESFYTKLPTKDDLDTSSFGLFYYAFEQIKKDGNVKNVVIDLSDNGGGSAAALVATLGFLSEDGEVKITYQDLLNRNYCTEWYHVDTNLDGRFDDEDGYGGQYNFYILTTGSSYSCGNAFPYFAQKENLATIIGEKPGGGDCVLAHYVDAYGHVGVISGFKQLGTMEGDTFISDETAVEVDIPFTPEEGDEIYFHPEKIAEFIAAQEN